MSDLFKGKVEPVSSKAVGEDEHGQNAYIEELKFARFDKVSMYGFFDILSQQVVSRVLTDYRAQYSALKEVFSGVAQNINHKMSKLTSAKIPSVSRSQSTRH